MKKQEEIPFQKFNHLPSFPSLYFVQDEKKLRKLFREVNAQELYVVMSPKVLDFKVISFIGPTGIDQCEV